MTEKFISIIIPFISFNKNLDNLIINFIKYKLNDVELILVNDGSNLNNNKNFLKNINNIKNIKLINIKTNKGVSNARNTGLKKSGGKYVIFCDSDDQINFYNLNSFIKFLKRSKNFSNFDLISFKLKSYKLTNQVKNDLYGETINQKNLINQIVDIGLSKFRFVCWRYAYKRSFLIDNKILFSKKLRTYEDVVFLVKVFLHLKICLNSNYEIITQNNQKMSLSNNNIKPNLIIFNRALYACEELIKITKANLYGLEFLKLVIKKIINDKLPIILIKKVKKDQINIINRIFLFLNYKKNPSKDLDKNIRTFYKLKILNNFNKKKIYYFFCYSYWSIVIFKYLVHKNYKIKLFLDNEKNLINKNVDKKNSVYVKSPLILKKSKQYKNLTILIINSSYKTYYMELL